MEAHADHADHAHDHHHEIPTEGRALTGMAVSATLHCLTGCAIGEVSGMAIGTALGFSDFGTIALAVGLAFIFGYALTSLPLLRAGLALSVVIPVALAADTLSIATMEVVDNAIMLLVPGAMESGLGNILFWGALSFALAVAFVVTVPVNRWLLARGKGHAALHETGIHGGPDTRIVGAVTVAAAVFGVAVLAAEGFDGESAGHGGGHEAAGTVGMVEESSQRHGGHGSEEPVAESGAIPGVTVSEDGLRLALGQRELPVGRPSRLTFQILGENGAAIRDFDVEHTKRMHLIVVRRDMTGFQHLHPALAGDGTWSTPIEIPEAGSYRVFADFRHEGSKETLGADLAVDGATDYRGLPDPSTSDAAEAYEVTLDAGDSSAGEESELAFRVTLDGEEVHVEPYLGADGHLVALREGDLAYLHVHPAGHDEGSEDESAHDDSIRFLTEFPTEGRYRLFLQFKHQGEVRTAEFTREVSR